MNPEFNQYIHPMYMTDTNMLFPIVNINLGSVYDNVVELATAICQIGFIIVYIFVFIVKEVLVAVNNRLTIIEKILLTLCLYNLINQWVFELRNNNENDKIKDVEKEMSIYKEILDEHANIINENQETDKIIFHEMAQLSKEVRKIKKEIEKRQ
jgi:hypothetical protein